MKKAYSKPQIYFDSFELSQDIAAGCVEIVSKEEKEDGLFAVNSCVIPSECYHVFTPESPVFTS